jgi:glycosyltransferase involved in cell wall biosynthesis
LVSAIKKNAIKKNRLGMKILELNFEGVWRGGERQTLYNMIGFRQAGVHVELLCRAGAPLEAKARAEGFTTHAFANTIGVFFFLAFRGRRYQVMHAQTSHILTYAVLTRVFHKAKLVFTRRIYSTPSGGLTRWKYGQTDKIITISPAVQEVMERFTGKKVCVISDIIVERRQLNRPRALSLIGDLQLRPGGWIIGTTAALTLEKGPFVMIEAVRILAAKRKDFIFVHFGTGNLEPEMKTRIKEYGLEHLYYLEGFVEGVEDVFSVLNVFVISSEKEGLGSSVLDAFIYKVPVVSTDAGGLADLVQEGRGISCKKNDPGQIAAGIDAILNDPLLRESMTGKAFTYVNEFHSMEYITNQYLEQLKDLEQINLNK